MRTSVDIRLDEWLCVYIDILIEVLENLLESICYDSSLGDQLGEVIEYLYLGEIFGLIVSLFLLGCSAKKGYIGVISFFVSEMLIVVMGPRYLKLLVVCSKFL